MSDSRAFVKTISAVGSGLQEGGAVHEVSPAWVLTFVRWENRDTFRNAKVRLNPTDNVNDKGALSTRAPLVVENDCIQVSTNMNKGTLTPSMTATLIMTDVNYETAVAPGDFVFVNILNWDQDARRVANKARALKPINGASDGFKGIFKIQSARKVVTVDPNDGTKTVLFRISGFAFTEFNNTIYFNPYLIDPNQDLKNLSIYMSNISKNWASFVNNKGIIDVQNIIALLIQSFIGQGISDLGKTDKSGLKTPNTHFFVPEKVGTLLGVPSAKAAKDIYNYLFGVQKYGGGSATSLGAGMNPAGLKQTNGRFLYTPTLCQGSTIIQPEYWNQVKAWSIINQFTNAPLNELYTCFRIDPSGKVMPTLVFRQIPFTTEEFKAGNLPITRFMNLPRWKLNPALASNPDLGRDEAARINFVQYFGKSSVGKEGTAIAQENAIGNFVFDSDDIQRNGLRPYVVTSQFDEIGLNKTNYLSPGWAKILGDCIIGGHLKMNGTIAYVGVVEPVAVGDNLEFDNVVYHIEQISHNAVCDIQSGMRMFTTTFSVSYGVSIKSNTNGTRYAEMDHIGGYETREADAKSSNILPGISESQEVVYRKGIDLPHSPDGSFPQPKGGVDYSSTDKKDGNK